MRILIVEDERKMGVLLKNALEEQAHCVQLAFTGSEGLQYAVEFPFDVITLDVMLPDISGFDVVNELRNRDIRSPVLFLTARDSDHDLVRALDLGGDDYLTKPFSFLALQARLRALARRTTEFRSRLMQVSDLVLNTSTHEVTRSGSPVELSRTEYLLLEFLMRQSGRLVLRLTLFHAVWGFRQRIQNNTLDAFMGLLRKKIDHGHSEKLIQTVRGFGYRIGDPKPQ